MRHMRELQLSLIDTGSSTHSLSVLLSPVEGMDPKSGNSLQRKYKYVLNLKWHVAYVIIGVS